MSYSPLLRISHLSRRFVLLLAVFASSAVVLGCRGSKEPPAPAAESRATTPGAREIVVDKTGRLQKVIGATGEATTGVARGVRLIRNGSDVTPELGIELREGDRVVTGGGTRAVIGSDVSSEISLGPNSDLTIRRASGFLSLGSLLVSVQRLFRIETRFLVAGVEGTEFSVFAGPSDVTAVAVLEGSVRVESKVEKWAPRSYREGEQCLAQGAAEPEKRALDDQTRERLLLWRADLVTQASAVSGASWEIRPRERALSTGRIVLKIPGEASASVAVFQGDAEVGRWWGQGSKSLLPGYYNVTVSGAMVSSVPVQKGMDTRIRAGVLKIKDRRPLGGLRPGGNDEALPRLGRQGGDPSGRNLQAESRGRLCACDDSGQRDDGVLTAESEGR
jgi:FecR protein